MTKLNSCMQKIKDDIIKRQNHPDVRFRRETTVKLERLETKINLILEKLTK